MCSTRFAALVVGVLVASCALADEKKDPPPLELTLRDAYLLALDHAQHPAAPPAPLTAERLDQLRQAAPQALEAIRAEYRAGPPTGPHPFQDPLPATLDLLVASVAASLAKQRYDATAQFFEVIQELRKGEASAVSNAEVDAAFNRTLVARSLQIEADTQHANALDRWHAQLNLPPDPNVQPANDLFAPFDSFGEKLTAWQQKADRDLAGLETLFGDHPRSADLSFNGKSLLPAIASFSAAERERIEQAIAQAPGPPSMERTMRIRRDLRELGRLRVEHAIQVQRFQLAVRDLDRFQDRVGEPVSPQIDPNAESPRFKHAQHLRQLLADFLDKRLEFFDAELETLTIWARSHSLAHSLARDLGLPPFESWDKLPASD